MEMTYTEIPCRICETLFLPAYRNVATCSPSCRDAAKKKRLAEWRNHKYKTDPVYRARVVESVRKLRMENPDRAREIARKFREKPEEREKARQKSRAWHAANRLRANQGRGQRVQKERVHKPWKKLVDAARSRSKKFGLPFDLTEEWAKERWTGKCELTGIEFTIGLKGVSAKLFSPSIDKINPKKGYVQDNCRVVLWCVNAFKYTGENDDHLYLVAEALLKNRPITPPKG